MDSAQAAGAQLYDISTAEGLAEAAWESLLTNHEIAVPLLLIKGQRRNRDNTLSPVREMIGETKEIRRRIEKVGMAGKRGVD